MCKIDKALWQSALHLGSARLFNIWILIDVQFTSSREEEEKPRVWCKMIQDRKIKTHQIYSYGGKFSLRWRKTLLSEPLYFRQSKRHQPEAGRRGWDSLIMNPIPDATTHNQEVTHNSELLPEDLSVWTPYQAPQFLTPTLYSPRTPGSENQQGFSKNMRPTIL